MYWEIYDRDNNIYNNILIIQIDKEYNLEDVCMSGVCDHYIDVEIEIDKTTGILYFKKGKYIESYYRGWDDRSVKFKTMDDAKKWLEERNFNIDFGLSCIQEKKTLIRKKTRFVLSQHLRLFKNPVSAAPFKITNWKLIYSKGKRNED